jgi:ribose transport system substrate-binding protein
MQMNCKTIFYIAVSLMALTGPVMADDFKIGSMVWDTSNPFYVNFIKGQQDAAAKLGVALDVQNGNSKLETQVAVVQQFIAQKKDLIIVVPGDAQGIVPVVKEADAAKIPVIAANNNVAEGGPVVTFVGSSNYEFGKIQCELLIQAIGENGNVGYIMGALGTDPQVNRKKGFDDCLAAHPGIKVVAEQTANWDNAQALAVVQDWLNKYPAGQLAAIVDQGPEGVTGAQNANQSGRTDVKFVLGNYPASVQKAIQNGIVFGAIVEDPYRQGYTSVEYATSWLKGEKDKVERPTHFMKNPVVTKENAATIPPEM